ncbi:hypothetical protein O181_059147 [Austropuccinia psidii MF-1]|uniref:Uncharacterized protein n=1 Tax=Austropuccinia psidii MF-1 TaxID=1389203 RepID=A0A9Q3HX55_9BASI|nr:hypothetical protein [Austropuccinia psidii MF-1]
MICLVLALNIGLKMSSKLTSICGSNHSDSPPSVLYGAGVFDNLRELCEESMAPTDIYDINKTYNGLKSVRGPPSANSETLGNKIALRPTIISQTIPEDYGSASRRLEAPIGEPPTSYATGGHSNCETTDQGIAELLTSVVFFSSASVTGSGIRCFQQWTNTSSSWSNTGGPIHPQGNPIKVAPEVPILVTRKDGRLGKLKRNLVAQDENDTDANGSDDIDEELEITTPIQK